MLLHPLPRTTPFQNTGTTAAEDIDKNIQQTIIYRDKKNYLWGLETAAYARFAERGGYPGLLYYYGHPNYAPRTLVDFGLDGRTRADVPCFYKPHDRKYYFRFYSASEDAVPQMLKRRWAIQIAETMAFVHSCGVTHERLSCFKILIDRDLNAKVTGFTNAQVDSPWILRDIHADLVGFGLVLFGLLTGKWPGLDVWQMFQDERRWGKPIDINTFPDTEGMGRLGEVSRKCWSRQYQGFEEVVADLKMVDVRLW
ncbi:hypothetical protein VTJ04DRAFT_540 [Mycothermus thermophilus]|uniref:uncharacterized protein n=1 Tax=Humicola insolens TaxID=85995 RepID=UPI0037441B41